MYIFIWLVLMEMVNVDEGYLDYVNINGFILLVFGIFLVFEVYFM